MFTSVQCLPGRILVHYQFQVKKIRKTPEMVINKGNEG